MERVPKNFILFLEDTPFNFKLLFKVKGGMK